MKEFAVRTKACSERGRIKERPDLKWHEAGGHSGQNPDQPDFELEKE